MDMIEELIPQGNDRIVCVKVSKVLRENLYEMTRKYWVMKLERASKATHVLAIVDGVVKAVYIPEKWYHSKDKGKEHRLEFIGKEDHFSMAKAKIQSNILICDRNIDNKREQI